MSERLSMRLWEPAQGYRAIGEVWRHAKALLLAGHRLVLELRPETRSLSQNAHFHALCSDVAAAGLPWAGMKRTAAEWKVLLVSGHAVATEEQSEIVPGLEGEFVNIRESTALMSKARGSSLIEYTLAFCAANNVALREFEQWQVDPETGEFA